MHNFVFKQTINAMNDQSTEIKVLRGWIEDSVGRVMHTPADFIFLSGAVWERIHEYISPTTLKRVWGYIDGVKQIRYSTLVILSKFAGFKSWDNYIYTLNTELNRQSDIVSQDKIDTSELNPGDVVEVSWNPDRICQFTYKGDYLFEITMTENNHLKVGDTASVMIFVLGEPLLLSNLTHQGRSGLTYLCGGRDGITALQRK